MVSTCRCSFERRSKQGTNCRHHVIWETLRHHGQRVVQCITTGPNGFGTSSELAAVWRNQVAETCGNGYAREGVRESCSVEPTERPERQENQRRNAKPARKAVVVGGSPTAKTSW